MKTKKKEKLNVVKNKNITFCFSATDLTFVHFTAECKLKVCSYFTRTLSFVLWQ